MLQEEKIGDFDVGEKLQHLFFFFRLRVSLLDTNHWYTVQHSFLFQEF